MYWYISTIVGRVTPTKRIHLTSIFPQAASFFWKQFQESEMQLEKPL